MAFFVCSLSNMHLLLQVCGSSIVTIHIVDCVWRSSCWSHIVGYKQERCRRVRRFESEKQNENKTSKNTVKLFLPGINRTTIRRLCRERKGPPVLIILFLYYRYALCLLCIQHCSSPCVRSANMQRGTNFR